MPATPDGATPGRRRAAEQGRGGKLLTMRTMNARVAHGLAVVVGAWLAAGPLAMTTRPQAQGRPPVAIVGARIIDGTLDVKTAIGQLMTRPITQE